MAAVAANPLAVLDEIKKIVQETPNVTEKDKETSLSNLHIAKTVLTTLFEQQYPQTLDNKKRELLRKFRKECLYVQALLEDFINRSSDLQLTNKLKSLLTKVKKEIQFLQRKVYKRQRSAAGSAERPETPKPPELDPQILRFYIDVETIIARIESSHNRQRPTNRNNSGTFPPPKPNRLRF